MLRHAQGSIPDNCFVHKHDGVVCMFSVRNVLANVCWRCHLLLAQSGNFLLMCVDLTMSRAKNFTGEAKATSMELRARALALFDCFVCY